MKMTKLSELKPRNLHCLTQYHHVLAKSGVMYLPENRIESSDSLLLES